MSKGNSIASMHTPDKLYRAFLDPQALAKWLPPHGFTCQVHHLDAKVGGGFKMSFTNFGSGHSHSFGGTYLELRPGELLRYTDVFDDPTCRDRWSPPSASRRCPAAPS